MLPKRIKIGKYKTVFKGVFYDILHAKAILPNGKTTVFEHIKRPSSASVLAFDDKGRLLLTREYRYNHQAYKWRVPAGRVDKGETPMQAAQRELREEAGYRAKNLKLFLANKGANSAEWNKYFFIATGLTKDPLPLDEGEEIRVVPTALSTAFKMVLDGKIDNEMIAYAILRLYQKEKKKGKTKKS